ncbi:MAG TPA: Ig-like domain-containing protein [Vicinamibacterales bacterium]|nr:Ig-like domain-containing protein [Vicinamibacterales bacterium]
MAFVCAALLSQTAGQAQSPDTLTYSRGFLLPGGYVVGGVDLLRTGGTGTINFNADGKNTVPADAEIKAAYLYWETVEPEELTAPGGVEFRGVPVEVAKATRITSLPGTGASCWGSSGGSNAFLTMYRADVLHLLPKLYDVNDKWTGRYIVNDADLQTHKLPLHTVNLPQAGTGNRTKTSAGATLAIVYGHPAAPLTKILFYDGAAVQAQGAITTHTLSGFYKASAAPTASLTYVAGTGADNKNDRLLFNGSVVANDPFPAPIDGNSDRGWANPTYDVSSLMSKRGSHVDFGETVTTRVDHGARAQKSSPYECLAFGGIILSMTLADVDADGVPDGLEDAMNGLKDPPTPDFPNGTPVPNLYGIGARTGQRDLIVEFNAMRADAGTQYGSADAPFNDTQDFITDHVGHDHMPSPAVIKMVGDTYAANGIRLHADVGSLEAYAALFPCPVEDLACDASEYLVPTEHARGGERILERACESCQFSAYPGTIGYPYGVQLYQYAPVNADGGELTTFEDVQRATLENGELRRRFDRIREPYVRYALIAHARGKAKSKFPCLDGDKNETGYDPATASVCADAPNPKFHVPSSVSGVADLPGGKLMVTLGLWDRELFVGSQNLQVQTLLHEFGHLGGLWHGGGPAVFGNKALNTATHVEPNCKPFPTLMSYQFQAHGIFDDFGNIRFDYSGSKQDTLNESSLADGPLTPPPPYRAAWFVPVNSPLALAQAATAAKRFCNGAPFDGANPMMARIVADSSDQAIDWDGDPKTQHSASDVNFDGDHDTTLVGHNDWQNFRLDLLGFGRSAKIVSSASGDLLDFGSGDLLDFGSGDLLDFGSGDLLDFGSGTHIVHLGSGDFFRYGSGDLLDFGSGDLLDFGSGDLLDFGSGALMYVGASGDLLDFGSGDLLDFGSGDLLDFGSGDLLDFGSGDLLDFGSGDLLDFGSGDLLDFGSGTGLQELDFETALAMERPRPHGLRACVLGRDCPEPPPQPQHYHRVRLDWNAPTFGTVLQYEIFRGTAEIPDVSIGFSTTTTFIDEDELPDGVEFIYLVRAFIAGDEDPSAKSDPASVVAVNIPPVAVDDAYVTDRNTQLVVGAPGVLVNDTEDVDSPATSRRLLRITAGPSNGVLAAAPDGGFTYTPETGFVGTDTFTYLADNGAWSEDPEIPLSDPSNEATVTIRVVQYRFRNVENLPPPADTTFNTGTTVPLQWQWTDADGIALDTRYAQVVVQAFACSTSGALPAGTSVGVFTPPAPGTGNSFEFDTTSFTWKFIWKLVVEGSASDLPAGTYVVQVKSSAAGTVFPVPQQTHFCDGTVAVRGALFTVN